MAPRELAARFAMAAALLSMPGCANNVPAPNLAAASVPAYENPMLVAVADRDLLWHALVDVVDDYFTIDREEPVRLVGEVLTEGRIDTFAEGGSTYFEPWRLDAANSYEKWEGTLQSIRRLATVRVLPSANGFFVEVAVFKELEDVPRPDRSTTAQATFRNDNSLLRPTQPVGERITSAGWIPLGRDAALEQRMLDQLRMRLAVPSPPLYPPIRS